MRVRFQADADLNEDIVAADVPRRPRRSRSRSDVDLNEGIVAAVIRREPRIEFVKATAGGLTGLSDPEVLALAASTGRVLVTHDQKTMPGHFATFLQASRCPGVLVVPQRYPVAFVAAESVLIWEASTPDEWQNVLLLLPLGGT